jgi:hypothetical protein
MVSRWDLTFEEWNGLLHLYRVEDVAPSKETEEKLRAAGLIDDRNTLSAAGKSFIEHELLMERRNRLQR